MLRTYRVREEWVIKSEISTMLTSTQATGVLFAQDHHLYIYIGCSWPLCPGLQSVEPTSTAG